MWFKNLAVYRFTEPFTLTVEELEAKLEQKRFRPCGQHEESSFGWTSPCVITSDSLTHSLNNFIMLCAKKEEKVIPAAVINEMLQDKISAIEDQEARKLSKKERSRLKDELVFELLPRAFGFSRKTHAYIDPDGGWIIVDAASAKKAEDLLSQLRKCLGTLPVIPFTTVKQPPTVMTEWLKNSSAPSDFLIEDECELRSRKDEGSVIRCKRHDLTLPEIKNHLDHDKQVIKLALNWSDHLAFILDENLAIKRLKFLDLVQDRVDDTDAETELEHFDAEFSIMTQEFSKLLPRLAEVFDDNA